VGNVSAFGRTGPDAALAGMDLVVQARSGLMAANGRLRDGLPVAPEPPLADYMTAMTLAFGVAAALLRRERTGRGGEIEVSLLRSALTLQNNAMVRVEAADGAVHAQAREALARLRRDAVPWLEQIALLPQVRTLAMTGLYYRTYATRDGVLAVAAVSRALQRGFMQVVGLRDASHDEPIREPERLERHYAELGARAEAIIRGRATAEWKAALDEEGVPASDVRLPIEMLDDPQVVANEMARDLPHPSLGAVRVLAPPLALDGGGFRPTGATGAFASETRALLHELGLGDNEIDALVREGVTREAQPGPPPAPGRPVAGGQPAQPRRGGTT
jgi:formyl-CoA transferase